MNAVVLINIQEDTSPTPMAYNYWQCFLKTVNAAIAKPDNDSERYETALRSRLQIQRELYNLDPPSNTLAKTRKERLEASLLYVASKKDKNPVAASATETQTVILVSCNVSNQSPFPQLLLVLT